MPLGQLVVIPWCLHASWGGSPGRGGVPIPGGVHTHGDVALRGGGQWAQWGWLGGVSDVLMML